MNPELEKIAQDYAHDYRDMAMPQEDLENVFRDALQQAYELGRKDEIEFNATADVTIAMDKVEQIREEALKPFKGAKNPGEWEDSVWWDGRMYGRKEERDRIWHEHLGLGKDIRDVLG